MQSVLLNTTSVNETGRRGFTLVEMLIAVAIFVILTTIAISAFTDSDQDRAAAGAQQLKAMLEGAQSRALRDNQLRGVRLQRDETNPQIVNSLVYVGAPRFYEGVISHVVFGHDNGTPSDNSDDPRVQNAVPPPMSSATWYRNPTTLATGRVPVGKWAFYVQDRNPNHPNNAPDPDTVKDIWENLQERDLLLSRTRIEVPAFSGHYYVIDSVSEVNNTDGRCGTKVTIAGHYLDSRDIYSSPSTPGVPQSVSRAFIPITPRNVPFRLELAPPVLPGSDPVPLAEGIAIDLVASKLPNAWRNTNGTANNLIDDSFPAEMDILFTPRGDAVGQAGPGGALHFLIADLKDIEGGTRYATTDAQHPLVQNPETDDRIVSLFTRTGLVMISPLNRAGTFGSNNIYEFAIRGEDAP